MLGVFERENRVLVSSRDVSRVFENHKHAQANIIA
jgi:hypothetical protein